MVRRLKVAIAALSVFVAFAAVAIGQETIPPDQAGLDEYVESVPGQTGNSPSAPPGSTGGRDGQLPSRTESALEAHGPDGQAAADLAAAMAPPEPKGSGGAMAPQEPKGSGRSSQGDSRSVDGEEASALEGQSGIRGIVNQGIGAGAGGGMGLLLPLILAGTLLAALAAVVARRQRRSS